MIARAQIALYRLQREDETVARATQGLSDSRLKLARTESEGNKKAIQIESAKTATSHSDAPPMLRDILKRFVLPGLNSELEMLQKQEQQTRAEVAEAEKQLRDERMGGPRDLFPQGFSLRQTSPNIGTQRTRRLSIDPVTSRFHCWPPVFCRREG